MSTPRCGDPDLASLDDLVEQITVDAHDDDETLRAFRQALEDHAAAPATASSSASRFRSSRSTTMATSAVG
jgi:6-phosphogluconate dehydrogenase (decarboxylating)